jgi:hypothetical protein
VQEAEKWTEAQLLAAIREKLKSTRSVNKIAADLEKPSGWKKYEILVRLKRLVAAEKWSKAQLHAEINKRLEAGSSAGKISKELAAISGWKTWEISRILKAIREAAKADEKKDHVVIQEETIVPPDPSTIVHASKRRAEYLKWQAELLSIPGTKLHKVRSWGDPVMIAQAGYSVDIAGTTNFQAVKLWSPEGGWGGVTNFLYIPHEHVMKLAAMQIEDQFVAKKSGWSDELNMPNWLGQKMSWLCKEDGTIYMRAGGWRRASSIRWGTIALGGNLVAVEGIEVVTLKLPRETVKREVPMARLKGFRASDWDRPLDELLAEGLVHRCFCAYKSDHPGDTPKGIVYSPFYSPRDWDFAGTIQPKAFYVPVDWLET